MAASPGDGALDAPPVWFVGPSLGKEARMKFVLWFCARLDRRELSMAKEQKSAGSAMGGRMLPLIE
jgi:hypothetical protein